MIEFGFCICIILIIPDTGPGRFVAETARRIQIKQPEWNIHCLYLFQMVLLLKYLWEQRLSLVMLLKCFNRFFFGFLERNDIIRAVTVFELLRHDHRIIAIRTHRSSCCLFCQNLSTTGRTTPDSHICLLIRLPLLRLKPLPVIPLHFLYVFGLFLDLIQFIQ